MNKKDKSNYLSSRRSFIKKTSFTFGAIGTMSLSSLANNNLQILKKTKKVNELELTVAGYKVNRLRSLANGNVKIKGCSINFVQAGIGDINTSTFNGNQPYDITEIGLHPFMLAYANDNFRDYVLLPIFPVRIFRHKSIFIRNDRGINFPKDLKGKTIGTAGYSSTSLTWIRGILQDEYGIKPEDLNWVISNKDSSAEAAGKISKQERVAPKGISIKIGTAGLDESELLVSGEVDALFHAAEPKAYIDGNPIVERLFPDSKKEEQTYYKKTGVFPIMHSVAVKKILLEKYPWLAEAIFNAYSESKTQDYAFMRNYGWVFDSLPWYGQEFEETKKLMGDNYWAYGIKPNRKALETLFKYSYNQGLSSKKLTFKDLFHHSTLNLKEK